MSKALLVPILRSVSVLALAAAAAPAFAQSDGAPADVPVIDTATDPVMGEDLVVTGTNISGVKPVGSKATVLDKEAIQATGATSIADVVKTLPQVTNLGDFREGGTAGSTNRAQSTAINLRGLGPGATLILVDGRRIAPAGTGNTVTEANQVPMAALQRIEVITDGASAVYGSDAVAGVVNYVLRKDYDGIEASARWSNNSGADEWLVSGVFGTHWSVGSRPGNILLAYEHTWRAATLAGSNAWLRQDLRPVGGLDKRLNGAIATAGFAPNIVVLVGAASPTIPRAGTYTYYGVPSGSGTGLTAGSFLVNQPNLVDSADYTDQFGRLRRDQVSGFLNQELTDWLDLFVSGIYTERELYTRQMVSSSTISLPASSPYYVAGVPGVAAGAPLTVQYNFYKDVGDVVNHNDAKTYTITAGFNAKLPGGWKAETYYTRSRDRTCGVCVFDSDVNTTAFQALVTNGTINPLSSAALPASITSRFTGDNVQWGTNATHNAVLKFNGPLFGLPAGAVRAAVGGEWLRTTNSVYNYNHTLADNATRIVADTDMHRTTKSAFAELYVPVVSAEMGIPLIRELNLNGAVRYDDYSDFGGTTNPKVGLTWTVNSDLTIRGTWGTSFRAPWLSEMNPNIFSLSLITATANNSGDASITDPNRPGFANVYQLQGGNADLGPETATSWSLGVDFAPSYLPGLKASATYYNIDFSNRIAIPSFGSFYSSPANYALWADYITPVRNPSTCVNGIPSTYGPALQPFVALPWAFNYVFSSYCAITVVSDGRNTNLARTKQDGLDFNLNYAFGTGIGQFNLGGSVTKMLSYTTQPVSGGVAVDRLGYYSTPVEWRGRGSISWNHQSGFAANLFANYIGSYTNDENVSPATGLAAAPVEIDAWTTFDLNLSYSIKPDSFGPLNGLRLSATILNLFDRNPNLAVTSLNAYNPANSNPYGRTYTLQLTTSF